MKFFDDRTKTINKLNRNYFFIGSLFFSLLTILLFAIFGETWPAVKFEPNGVVYGMQNFWVSLLAPFSFNSWTHVLGCTFILLICSMYLERKWGTFSFVGIFLINWILGCLCTQVSCHLGITAGSSMVYYGLYAINFVDLLFSFHKSRRSVGNIIYGIFISIFAIVMISLYSGNGSASSVQFTFLSGFFSDPAHLSSFISGLIFATVLYSINFINTKKQN